VSHTFIVAKGAYSSREKFPSFSISFHLFDKLRDQTVVFLFGVLGIEDAILLVAKSDTTKKIGRIVAIMDIVDIIIVIRSVANESIMSITHSITLI
jgi:hypothetical protein